MRRPEPLPPLSREPFASVSQALVRARDRSLEVVGAALESLLGRAELVAETTRAIETDSLTTDILQSLFTDECAVVHVRGFCPESQCQALSDWVLSQFKFTNWGDLFNAIVDEEKVFDTDMFYGVGLAAAVILNSEELRGRYFTEALASTRKARLAMDGAGIGPTDKLRLELDELWPHGAQIKLHDVYRRKMLAGVGRLMRPSGMLSGLGDDGLIHVDYEDSFQMVHSRKRLFSSNVYMTVPRTGGELLVWDVRPSLLQYLRNFSYFQHFRDVFTVAKAADAQRNIRSALPDPIVVKPERGDLVIFNAVRPHAVRSFDEPCRLTFQTFIEHVSGEPLKLFA
jgi:hypothetical protein